MLPYFFVTIPIAIMAVATPKHRRGQLLWGLAFVVILLFVGLRHHVGMDWNNYLTMINRANSGNFWQSFRYAEPGYATLLWIAGQNGWGIYGAYFMGTLIFAAGLFRYAKTTPSPWIALLVAMPFLVIVVAMSAARQAVAIGVLLWLVAEWSRASVLKRIVLILIATSFHISAIGFLAFVLLDLRQPIWVKAAGSALLGLLMIYVLQETDRVDYYNDVYVSSQTAQTQSGGAIFHVTLNGGPALLSFLLGRRAHMILLPSTFHKQLAILAIILIPLALVISAASGRFTLYLFPVSMWFFASLPLLFQDKSFRLGLKIFIAVFFVGLLAFWLNVGNSATAHANYRNALFVSPYELVLCCNGSESAW